MNRAWIVALGLLVMPLRAQDTIRVYWAPAVAGQLRFLYDHMDSELVGCLYGHSNADTVVVTFFISAFVDPRLASDSTVPQGGCPNITTVNGSSLIGIVHSHIRPTSVCFPSDAKKDLGVLAKWMEDTPVAFGAIICAHGDSIATYNIHGRTGIMAVPPLDSLYGVHR